MCLCVDRQYVVQVLSDAPGAGVTNGCEPPGVGSGTQNSGRAVHALNQQATS